MRWVWRELSLATVVASVVLVIQPGWSADVSRAWLVVFALLISLAVIFELFSRAELSALNPGVLSDRGGRGNREPPQALRDVSEAREFVTAVDYTLVPFLRSVAREVATHRLLAHHALVLDSDPVRAHLILGDLVWQALELPVGTDVVTWPTNRLDELIGALERI